MITPCFSKRFTLSKQGVGDNPTFFDKSILEILPLRCNSFKILISMLSNALFNFFSITFPYVRRIFYLIYQKLSVIRQQ